MPKILTKEQEHKIEVPILFIPRKFSSEMSPV